ncbi:MAG: hypothetical protein PHW40_03395 [Candidatus Izemoplasmatales bacterium]|nr:hypothetical protein [Candidatus Izemoplasmatales bacterium]MDD5293339.1 hypothetical protein [Candidatus Izemoplasmatales bacterium]
MPDPVVTFLTRTKRLIRLGRCRFESRQYPDGRDYLTVLTEDFMITVAHAWEQISRLTQHLVVCDGKPDYEKDADTYVFKKTINSVVAYIKIKIEHDSHGEVVVVISFHKDDY